MWVLGGATLPSTDVHNDAWWSTDGQAWTLAVDGAPWAARDGHACVVFNDKLFIMGGYAAGAKADVWSSSDGTNWTQATENAPWSPRMGHASIVHDGKVWIFGGRAPDDGGGSSPLHDVWFSSDCQNWTQATDAAPCLATNLGVSALSYENAMWVNDGHRFWRSLDGANWVGASPVAPWRGRAEFGSAAYANKLWVVGGSRWYPDSLNRSLGDAWSSPDGITWTESHPSVSYFEAFNCLVSGGKLWAIAGDSLNSYGHVWSTTDGTSWVQESTHGAFTNEHSSAVFDGKMWAFGGYVDNGDEYIFKSSGKWSTDGHTWTSTGIEPWGPRAGHASVVFDGKVWILGGGPAAPGDVWSSPDGDNWMQELATAPWAPRWCHAAAVIGNRMWVMGGYRPTQIQLEIGEVLNDVWSSPDGVDWTQATAAAPWYPRCGHAAVVLGNRLWVYGGIGENHATYNDVWYSEVATTDFFTELPQGGWKEESQPLALTVGVPGPPDALTYQWVKDGVNITGATDSTFSIPSLTVADTGWYSCIVTDDTKAQYQTPPVLIQVFPEGSLPTATRLGLLLTIVLLSASGGALMLHRRRPESLLEE